MSTVVDPASDADERHVRLTEREALANVRTVLKLCAAGLVADVHRRAGQLTDLGHVRVIECADPATAALIARDRTLRSLCRPIGDRHLAVPPDQELRFRKALIARGHVFPVRSMT
jgi:hypothetical protein